MENICPVCGYPDLREPAYDEYNCSSFEICVSCGIEYGYGDQFLEKKEDCWEYLRKEWISNGMKWHSKYIEKSIDWNPVMQLYKLSQYMKPKEIESDYTKLVESWAKKFEENRYIPTQAEIDAMHSDIFFDIINNENRS